VKNKIISILEYQTELKNVWLCSWSSTWDLIIKKHLMISHKIILS